MDDQQHTGHNITSGGIGMPGQGLQKIKRLEERVAALKTALREALNELGVPTDDYPAPVANAVRILSEALSPDVERD